MPVRSLDSSVLRWPNRAAVDAAARRWAETQRALHPELKKLGYFGSYARGNWGVGSDLDLIALVSHGKRPFGQRAMDWDLDPLPVPAEILVYTESEWARLEQEGGRFFTTVTAETVWI
ncbi:hypothetical protein THSYN_11550 [Candidatus Thiodictyon syntrophicum]|uniref:Polymerase nucleotidyl transferase domain-containing protein n=2 Tax=Candidatus Thiodictyon syntrophicum TaxID=1166950 RepID=A0A2K8U7K1_9GAMM|nr:nucleotidyltransferase domain-containing protein [Candidatus Thiodictyon syntrophicum]AUB81524.1 hypothetical protein THSYN_11550 [Candidatus Thiodictyon syntrophicum]